MKDRESDRERQIDKERERGRKREKERKEQLQTRTPHLGCAELLMKTTFKASDNAMAEIPLIRLSLSSHVARIVKILVYRFRTKSRQVIPLLVYRVV